MLKIIIIITYNIITISIQFLFLPISPTFSTFWIKERKKKNLSSLVFVQIPHHQWSLGGVASGTGQKNSRECQCPNLKDFQRPSQTKNLVLGSLLSTYRHLQENHFQMVDKQQMVRLPLEFSWEEEWGSSTQFSSI